MLSAIGLATQLRAAGARLAAPIARQAATAPTAFVRRSTIHGTVVVRRGFSVTRSRPAAAEGTARKTKPAATKKPATKKTAAKKTTPKKKKPVEKKVVAKKRTAQKDLSETAKKKLLRTNINELKSLAFYGENPKVAQPDAWAVFLSRNLKGSFGNISEHARNFHNLSAAERAELNLEADRAKLANRSACRAWLETKKPVDILVANYARTALKLYWERQGSTMANSPKISPIVDDRFPKKPRTVVNIYIKSRYESGDLAGVPFAEVATRLRDEWAGLSDAERKPFMDASEASRASYEETMSGLLGPDWKRLRLAKRSIVDVIVARIKRIETPGASASPSPSP